MPTRQSIKILKIHMWISRRTHPISSSGSEVFPLPWQRGATHLRTPSSHFWLPYGKTQPSNTGTPRNSPKKHAKNLQVSKPPKLKLPPQKKKSLQNIYQKMPPTFWSPFQSKKKNSPQTAQRPVLGSTMIHALRVAAAAGVHHMDQAVGVHQVVEEGVAAAAAQIGTCQGTI